MLFLLKEFLSQNYEMFYKYPYWPHTDCFVPLTSRLWLNPASRTEQDLRHCPIEPSSTDLFQSFCTNGAKRKDSKDLERDKSTEGAFDSHGGKLVIENRVYRFYNLDRHQPILLDHWNVGVLLLFLDCHGWICNLWRIAFFQTWFHRCLSKFGQTIVPLCPSTFHVKWP